MKYGHIGWISEPCAQLSGRRPDSYGLRLLALAVVLWLVSGCAAPRPVIYEAAPGANRDVEQCMQRARAAGADSGKGAAVARDVGVGAAMGGAAAGAWGAVRGDSDVGQRAAAGAAAGASAALIRGAVRSSEPTEVFRGYVNQCLRERGHQVVGWQ